MVNYINQLVKVYILNNSDGGHGIVAQLYIKQVFPFIIFDKHPAFVFKTIYFKSQSLVIRKCRGAMKAPRKHYHQLCTEY